jgi:CBS-domain-containing membrane protein
MKVKEIMSTDPACCTRETPLQDVAILMIEHDCGEIPVVDHLESKRPVGVVTDRDITVRTVALGKNPLDLRARDCMSSPAVTVTPETSVEHCCNLMEENQLRRIPVVDASGCCCGIVSQADIAQHASKGEAGELVKDVSRKTHHGASRSPMTQV